MRHPQVTRQAAARRDRSQWVAILIGALIASVGVGCVGEMAQPPEPVSCTAKSSRTCFCADGDSGVQSCSEAGDMWSECRCNCTPRETEECFCESGEIGLRECHSSGEFWTSCQCLTEEEWLRRQIELEEDPNCGVGENTCEGVGCVSLANSDENCGACGVVCEGCDRCFRGVCTTVCCPNETNCGSTRSPVCSDLDSDPDNCGGCGVLCAGGEMCLRGDCVPQ